MKALKTILRSIFILSAIAALIAFIMDQIDQKKRVSAHRMYGFYERDVKRPLDAFLSTLALLLLWPVYLVLALVVKGKLGSPVIFAQERPGRDGRIFRLLKFRTMTDERDEGGHLLPEEERMTPFGEKLRSTSLDELPEFYNIAKGDMALVGPRPLLVHYLPLYNKRQARRHEVRPGLTGLAQVHGRNGIRWEEKFDYDVKYVDHITFLTDLRILFDTVHTVIKHEGISEQGQATMAPFTGSDQKIEGAGD